jgi:hypothetical protein
MSQLTHPGISVRQQLRSHWILALSALLALLATAAIVLVLAIDGGSSETSTAIEQPQPALRADGGPDESAVAASVGSRASAGPSESSVAATIGGPVAERHTGGPNESVVASSLAPAPEQPRPDEARTAASISGR